MPSAAGVDGLIIVDLPPEEDARSCACRPGRRRPALHPPGDADHDDDKRLPKVLNQHQRLRLLRRDHRDHRVRLGRDRRRGRPRSSGLQGPYRLAETSGRRRLRHQDAGTGGAIARRRRRSGCRWLGIGRPLVNAKPGPATVASTGAGGARSISLGASTRLSAPLRVWPVRPFGPRGGNA